MNNSKSLPRRDANAADFNDISNKNEYQIWTDKVYPEVEDVPVQVYKEWLTSTDDDYADKVDTFVDNMVASDDNVFTHDSEGC